MCHCRMQRPWCWWDTTTSQKLHWIHQFITIIKNLDALICLDTPIYLDVPTCLDTSHIFSCLLYIQMPPIHLDTPICLNAPSYVLTPPYVWMLPHICMPPCSPVHLYVSRGYMHMIWGLLWVWERHQGLQGGLSITTEHLWDINSSKLVHETI